MDEYIKKNQALCCFSGWIDQNGVFHEPEEMIEYQRIEQLPAADVVSVVRCWECKHNAYCCRINPYERCGNDYCSHGVRKDSNSNGVRKDDEQREKG